LKSCTPIGTLLTNLVSNEEYRPPEHGEAEPISKVTDDIYCIGFILVHLRVNQVPLKYIEEWNNKVRGEQSNSFVDNVRYFIKERTPPNDIEDLDLWELVQQCLQE
jgi:hypothetical protein